MWPHCRSAFWVNSFFSGSLNKFGYSQGVAWSNRADLAAVTRAREAGNAPTALSMEEKSKAAQMALTLRMAKDAAQRASRTSWFGSRT